MHITNILLQRAKIAILAFLFAQSFTATTLAQIRTIEDPFARDKCKGQLIIWSMNEPVRKHFQLMNSSNKSVLFCVARNESYGKSVIGIWVGVATSAQYKMRSGKDQKPTYELMSGDCIVVTGNVHVSLYRCKPSGLNFCKDETKFFVGAACFLP